MAKKVSKNQRKVGEQVRESRTHVKVILPFRSKNGGIRFKSQMVYKEDVDQLLNDYKYE